MSTIVGMCFSKKGKAHEGYWRPILQSWFSLMQEYMNVATGDIPYWHSEQCNVSLLLSAAQRSGKVGVCEYLVQRATDRRGCMADFWISDASTAFRAEFKFKPLEVKTSAFPSDLLTHKDWGIDAAKKQVLDQSAPEEEIALGGIFFVPVQEDSSQPHTKTMAAFLASSLLEGVDIGAWFVPDLAQLIPASSGDHIGKFYMGVILLMSLADVN